MKRVLILACIALCCLQIFAQKNMQIRGRIKGLPDSTVVSLFDVNKPGEPALATAVAKKGRFVLKAKIDEPLLVSLNMAPDKTAMTFIDASRARVKGNFSEPERLSWKGSATARHFSAFKKKFDPLFADIVSINQQARQTGWTDSMAVLADRKRDTVQQSIDAFIAGRRSSPVSAFVLAATFQLNDDIVLADKRFQSLSASAVNNLYGKFLKETIAKEIQTAVGSVAPDFTQADTLGNPVSLSSFRGKYVLLDFWASWCGPCRQENPNVVASFHKFKDKNFTVLGVSLDRQGQKDRWLQAIHADKLIWTHVSDLQFWSNEVAQQYKVQSIPQNFLIGPDGKILAKNLRGPGLEAKLCELLGCE